MATSSILPTNSLEEFRIQFNNLVSDVSGITASDTVSGDFSVGGDLTVTGTTSFTGSGAGLSAGTTPLTTLDIDGGTDIGAAIVDADLLIIDDGAGGTNRKVAASRLKTYVEDAAGEVPIANLNIDGGTDIGADISDADLFIIDDGAGGTNRKVAASRLKTYNPGGVQWQAVVTGATTMVAGRGYFVNTTSSAFTMTLPASPSIGDYVRIIDYAGTFDSNTCTVGRNSQKIAGASADMTVTTERAGLELVFTDSTQGWLLTEK